MSAPWNGHATETSASCAASMKPPAPRFPAAFEAMVVSGGEGQGCVYCAPRNTFDIKDGDIGPTVSAENTASLIDGMMSCV